MNELEKIKKYIERTELPTRATSPYFMTMPQMRALEALIKERDQFNGLYLAFKFGMAKGWRAHENLSGK